MTVIACFWVLQGTFKPNWVHDVCRKSEIRKKIKMSKSSLQTGEFTILLIVFRHFEGNPLVNTDHNLWKFIFLIIFWIMFFPGASFKISEIKMSKRSKFSFLTFRHFVVSLYGFWVFSYFGWASLDGHESNSWRLEKICKEIFFSIAELSN